LFIGSGSWCLQELRWKNPQTDERQRRTQRMRTRRRREKLPPEAKYLVLKHKNIWSYNIILQKSNLLVKFKINTHLGWQLVFQPPTTTTQNLINPLFFSGLRALL